MAASWGEDGSSWRPPGQYWGCPATLSTLMISPPPPRLVLLSLLLGQLVSATPYSYLQVQVETTPWGCLMFPLARMLTTPHGPSRSSTWRWGGEGSGEVNQLSFHCLHTRPACSPTIRSSRTFFVNVRNFRILWTFSIPPSDTETMVLCQYVQPPLFSKQILIATFTTHSNLMELKFYLLTSHRTNPGQHGNMVLPEFVKIAVSVFILQCWKIA